MSLNLNELLPQLYYTAIKTVKQIDPPLFVHCGVEKTWVFGDEKIVNTHIKNIRGKLGVDCIETMRGVGYRIDKKIKSSLSLKIFLGITVL